jgi:hypothetical protein
MNKTAITFVEDIIFGDEGVYNEDRLFRKDLPAGCAEWLNDQTNKIDCLAYTCPCGCGSVGCIPVTIGEKVEKAWLWDGNLESPTLTPSIQKCEGCRWHGFLKAGVWEQC